MSHMNIVFLISVYSIALEATQSKAFKILREYVLLRMLYPAKLSIRFAGERSI